MSQNRCTKHCLVFLWEHCFAFLYNFDPHFLPIHRCPTLLKLVNIDIHQNISLLMLTRHFVNIVSVGSLPEFYCYHSFCLFLTITLFSFSLFIFTFNLSHVINKPIPVLSYRDSLGHISYIESTENCF